MRESVRLYRSEWRDSAGTGGRNYAVGVGDQGLFDPDTRLFRGESSLLHAGGGFLNNGAVFVKY